MSDYYDIAIIGSGPGGYVAAIRAAQLGLGVIIIERSHLGGICLNWGCIPTKALLKAGELHAQVSEGLGAYGLSVDNVQLDFGKVVERSRDAAKKLSGGVAYLMKKNKIEVVEGTATLARAIATPLVTVDLNAGGTRSISAESVILATGARARVIPELGMVSNGDNIWSYREAMVPSKIPATLVVIGSGAVGIEFASFYTALGTKVVVVESQDRILPVEDAEVSAAAQKAFEKRGIRFRLSTHVIAVERTASGVQVEVDVGGMAEVLEADVAIVAVGVVGNIEGLGLEDLGVEMKGSQIVTDEHGATNVPGLYAIGDVAGPPMLAHKAMHQGVHCVEQIAGKAPQTGSSPIPGCTYSQPQVASVGLTEAQAKADGVNVKVGRFLFRNNGKAIAAGETEGFIKTVFDAESGRLIGAHLIGPEVTELIQGFVIAMTLKATQADLAGVVFPHPTLSEVMHEAALAAYGVALHV